MVYGFEMTCRCRTHTLGRRVRGNQRGIFLLELLQASKQAIVSLIGNHRGIEYIIMVVMLAQFLPESSCLDVDGFGNRHQR